MGAHIGNATTWTIPGLPSLTIPAQPGEYVDAVVSTFRGEQQLELHLITAKYSLEWIHRELAVTQTLAKLNNPRKGDLAVTRIGPQKVWYRAVVLNRETAAEVQIMLLDYGTLELVDFRELFDMPATVRHIPPLSFPLAVPKPMLIGVREEDMRTTLKQAKLTFKLGASTDGFVFNGDDLRVFDKASGALVPVNEAVRRAGGQLERVEYNIISGTDTTPLPQFEPSNRELRKRAHANDSGAVDGAQEQQTAGSLLNNNPRITNRNPPSDGMSNAAVLAISVVVGLGIIQCAVFAVIIYRCWRKRQQALSSTRDEPAGQVHPGGGGPSAEADNDGDTSARAGGGHSFQKSITNSTDAGPTVGTPPAPAPPRLASSLASASTRTVTLAGVVSDMVEQSEERGSPAPEPSTCPATATPGAPVPTTSARTLPTPAMMLMTDPNMVVVEDETTVVANSAASAGRTNPRTVNPRPAQSTLTAVTLMATARIQSQSAKMAETQLSRTPMRSDGTQMATDWSFPAQSTQGSKTVVNRRAIVVETCATDPTIRGVASLPVDSRTSVTTPMMSTQRPGTLSTNTAGARRLATAVRIDNHDGETVKIDEPGGGPATAHSVTTKTALRFGAGRSDGVWHRNRRPSEDETSEDDADSEEDDSEETSDEDRIPAYCILSEEAKHDKLYYASSMSGSRSVHAAQREGSALRAPPSPAVALHDSDLETPRFEPIHRLLDDMVTTDSSYKITTPTGYEKGLLDSPAIPYTPTQPSWRLHQQPRANAVEVELMSTRAIGPVRSTPNPYATSNDSARSLSFSVTSRQPPPPVMASSSSSSTSFHSAATNNNNNQRRP
ncbi:unnamed protein product, partial [Mesorhabditis spiculigera]